MSERIQWNSRVKSLEFLFSTGIFKGKIPRPQLSVGTPQRSHRLAVYSEVILSRCFPLSEWTSKQQGDSALGVTVKSSPCRSLMRTDKWPSSPWQKEGLWAPLCRCPWWQQAPMDSWPRLTCSCRRGRVGTVTLGFSDLMQNLAS